MEDEQRREEILREINELIKEGNEIERKVFLEKLKELVRSFV